MHLSKEGFWCIFYVLRYLGYSRYSLSKAYQVSSDLPSQALGGVLPGATHQGHRRRFVKRASPDYHPCTGVFLEVFFVLRRCGCFLDSSNGQKDFLAIARFRCSGMQSLRTEFRVWLVMVIYGDTVACSSSSSSSSSSGSSPYPRLMRRAATSHWWHDREVRHWRS